MGDSYRPGGRDRGRDHDRDRGYRRDERDYDRGYDRRPPPPPYYNDPPPLSYDDSRSYRPAAPQDRQPDRYARQQPPPPRANDSDMHRFGQPQHFSRSDFSFDSGKPPPQYPPSGPRNGGNDNLAARRRDQRAHGNRNNRPGANRPFRPPGASERKLLTVIPGDRTPPQLEGMNEGKAGARYAEVISSDEEEGPDAVESDKEPPQPKWSNPETYTALPPPDESQRKRKDMVKLIRKARVESTDGAQGAASNAVASNDDFISLNFGNEGEEELIKPVAPKVQSDMRARASDGSMSIKGLANNAVTQLSNQPNVVSARVEVLEADSVGSRLTTLKRKRGADEEDDLETRVLKPPNKSLKRGVEPTGKVTRDWTFQGTDKQLAVPWLEPTGPYKISANARLHQEILDFHDFVGTKSYERRVREDLLVRLSNFIDEMHPGAQVHIFGSFAAGLYLPDADMDVTVLSPEFRSTGRAIIGSTKTQLWRIARNLERSGFAETTEVIGAAKVPLVKFVDRLTSLKVDMSFENNTGVAANETFQGWKLQFPAMPVIVMVIKQFLMMRGLNDVSCGGIGGFSITCLVTSLLQQMPRVQNREFNPVDNLGELLIEFLDFYGFRFNHEDVALRMNPPGYLKKTGLYRSGQIVKYDARRIMIIDPNNDRNDIAGGSKHILLIFNKFAEAKNDLLDAMDAYNRDPNSSRISLLGCMLGGNYDSFLWYRRHLKRVHEDVWGPVESDGR